MLAAHDALTTYSKTAQRHFGRLVTGTITRRAHSFSGLPDRGGTPGGTGRPGTRDAYKTRAFAKARQKARYRSLYGAGPTACFRTRPTDTLGVITASEFVGIG